VGEWFHIPKHHRVRSPSWTWAKSSTHEALLLAGPAMCARPRGVSMDDGLVTGALMPLSQGRATAIRRPVDITGGTFEPRDQRKQGISSSHTLLVARLSGKALSAIA
jgi:hypothetical protein